MHGKICPLWYDMFDQFHSSATFGWYSVKGEMADMFLKKSRLPKLKATSPSLPLGILIQEYKLRTFPTSVSHFIRHM